MKSIWPAILSVFIGVAAVYWGCFFIIQHQSASASRPAMSELVEVDGSVLEGGGQILRMATTLSVLQRIPIHLKNIRAGRKKPGLRPQHLKGLEIACDICKGKLENAVENSCEVKFYPGELTPGTFIGDTKTAGTFKFTLFRDWKDLSMTTSRWRRQYYPEYSKRTDDDVFYPLKDLSNLGIISVCLMLQVALPCALFSSGETRLQLIGGTNADMAPPIDHTITVFKHVLKRFGATFENDLIRRGFYPKGGGEVTISIQPVKHLTPIDLTDAGNIKRIWGVSFVAGQGEFLSRIMENMAASAESDLDYILPGIPVDIKRVRETHETAVGIGTGICLFGETTTGCVIGGTALGKKGIQAEEVGRNAAIELVDSLKANACVDKYTQDQIIILMALAAGKSRIKCGPITLHTQTAIHVAHLLTKAKFKVTPVDQKSTIIECEGIGKINHSI